jgi:hypothetical protein
MSKILVRASVGVTLSFFGWISLRYVAHVYASKMLLKYYVKFPEVGIFLATASNQYITVNPDELAVKLSIRNLIDDYLPLIGFNIPSEESLIDFLARKLQKPTGVSYDNLVKILVLAFEYGKSDSDEVYLEQKKQEVLQALPSMIGIG